MRSMASNNTESADDVKISTISKMKTRFGTAYHQLKGVTPNQIDPDAPLNVYKIDYKAAAFSSKYFSNPKTLEAVTNATIDTVFSHSESKSGTGINTEYLKDAKARDQFLQTSMVETAAKPVMITNLDVTSLPNHEQSLPGFFDGMRQEAAQVGR